MGVYYQYHGGYLEYLNFDRGNLETKCTFVYKKIASGAKLQKHDNCFVLYCIALCLIALDQIELNCVVFYLILWCFCTCTCITAITFNVTTNRLSNMDNRTLSSKGWRYDYPSQQVGITDEASFKLSHHWSKLQKICQSNVPCTECLHFALIRIFFCGFKLLMKSII